MTIGGYCTYATISIYKGEPRFYKNYVMPLVHLLNAETAHNLAIAVVKSRFLSRSNYKDPQLLV